jgi:hypothetical protein
MARVELAQQLTRGLIFLHQIPQRGVDWYSARLNERDRLGAIYSPDGEWSYARFEQWLLRNDITYWPRLVHRRLGAHR